MPYRYVPLLRTKAGETTALLHLTPPARQRVFPIIHLTSAVPATFAARMGAAWAGRPMALDGQFSFDQTGTPAAMTALFHALRGQNIPVIPSVQYAAPASYLQAVQSLLPSGGGLVVKTPLSQLGATLPWVQAQSWAPADVDLVVSVGHVADVGANLLEDLVAHTLGVQVPSPTPWRSVTLASSAAPKDMSSLNTGRNVVPRQDFLLWQNVHQRVAFDLDYGDYGVSHPDLTEPPGVAMARATVSARYTADNDWIILKGRSTTGAQGLPMAQQYRAHAQTLANDPQFGGLPACWGDTRIQQIAGGVINSGSRTTWVEIAQSRHLSLVADRLP